VVTVVTGVVAGRAVVEAVVRDDVRFSGRLQIALVFARFIASLAR